MKRQLFAASAAVISTALVLPTAAGAQISPITDGTGMAEVTLLTSSSAPVPAGGTSWIALNWTNKVTDASDFEVTAEGPPGMAIGYPENTDPFSSLWADNVLSPEELDYSALRISVEPGVASPVTLTVKLHYVSAGEVVEEVHEVVVPITTVAGTEETAAVEGPVTTEAPPTTEAPATTEPTPTTEAPATTEPTPTTEGSTVEALSANLPLDTGEQGNSSLPLTIANGEWKNADNNRAVTGQWQVGNPVETSWSGYVLQPGSTPSGAAALITGLEFDANDAGAFDVDGGVTSVRSRSVLLPADVKKPTLEFSYYFSYLSNATSDDYFRVTVVGENGSKVVTEVKADKKNVGYKWRSASVDLKKFAGETVYILIEAADNGTPSLIEAGIDGLVLRG